MSALIDQYSGIVLNQNTTATGSIEWRDNPYNSDTIYQTFYLPSDYERGTAPDEQRCPDLSGFQVFTNIDVYAQAATLDYTLDYYILGAGWSNLASGIAIGVESWGEVWFSIVFDQPIPVTPAMVETPFRFSITTRTTDGHDPPTDLGPISNGTYVINGIAVSADLVEDVPVPVTVAGVKGFLLLQNGEVTYQPQQGVQGLWYVDPSPLVQPGEAFRSDGKTPLIADHKVSLNFRILGLAADNGVDLLGNEYRSCVVTTSGDNSSTTGAQDTVWISPPMPSKFAVLSRYFDVRPNPVTPSIGLLNRIPNPNFEYDANQSTNAYDWQAVTNETIPNIFQISDGWAATGSQSLRFHASFSGLQDAYAGVGVIDPISITAGLRYSLRAAVQILSLPASPSGPQLSVNWLANDGRIISTDSVTGAVSLGTEDLVINGATAPANAVTATVQCTVDALGEGVLDFYIDAIMFTESAIAPEYFDGDMVEHEWLGQRGRSASAQTVEFSPKDESIVIDGLLVDPQTPNMAFNVYYSMDDVGTKTHMTERDWEQKLWQRVPQVYTATHRQQYVFPKPVQAKYVKVEFTNLQAQAYDPGNFQQPVTYKKFPTWVADYFIVQMERKSFVANLVNVENDALTFAYDYYLDDLDQSPADPVASPTDKKTIIDVANHFGQSAAGVVDETTLRSISLVMQSFRSPLGVDADTSTLFGAYIEAQVNAPLQPRLTTFESPQAPAPDLQTVSTLQREPVIFEQSMPVMFFFIPCRHTYKELQATFEYNRAYFAGVNDIAFLRHDYTTASDDVQYIESGVDTANAEINDFVVDTDTVWHTY